MPYFEVSAATGQNVCKSVEALLDLVMSRMENSIEAQLCSFNNNTTKLVENNSQLQKPMPAQNCLC